MAETDEVEALRVGFVLDWLKYSWVIDAHLVVGQNINWEEEENS